MSFPASPSRPQPTAIVGGETRSSSDRAFGHVPAIDALRGLAATAVVLFHGLHAFGAPGALPASLGLLRRGTEYGWLGVSVFFALSGWCIAQRIHAAFRRGESAPVFLLERALRIFPTYWAALAAALALRFGATMAHPASWSAGFPHGVTAWLGEILLLQPYLGREGFIMVSWTLVFELGFYLIAAVALIARRRGLPPAGLIAVGAVLCAWPWSGWQPAALLVLGRWPEFFAGVIAWRAARDGRTGAIIVTGGALALLPVLLPGGFAQLTCAVAAGTALVLMLTARARLPQWLRPLAAIGAFSYPLYLIHVSVGSPFLNLASRFVSAGQLAFAVVWAASVALAFLAGWLLHRAVEAPVERWRRSLFPSGRLRRPVASA